MTTYYVGTGGNDGNSGLTWALRKLTLNGAEDIPVVAGDTVYVGPGVYRETLTVDVSGGAGTEIVYIADVSGANTDNVGGVVRVTGSDDDQTATRAECITAATKNYRTFRGFWLDGASGDGIGADGCTNWTVEDFVIQNCGDDGMAIANSGATESSDWTIRRGMILACVGDGIDITANAAQNSSGYLMENLIIIGCDDGIILNGGVGDAEVSNCLILGMSDDGIDVATAPNAGHPLLVYNSLIMHCASNGVEATGVADMTENYNNFWGNATNRTNVNAGANSQTYLPLLNLPLLLDGYRFPPPLLGELSEWSPLIRITGTSTPSDDMLGFTRPTTAAKLSWGPVQFQDSERDTGTTYNSSTASIELPDAGLVQFIVPVDAVETTIQVRVNRQANYAGNNPRMIIREPGQSDRNTVDVGAVSTWNQLLDTFTPTGDTDYVTVILESRNTAAAGNYAVFFDDLFVR